MGVLAVTPRPSTCIQTGAKNQAVTEAGGWESARFKNKLKNKRAQATDWLINKLETQTEVFFCTLRFESFW